MRLDWDLLWGCNLCLQISFHIEIVIPGSCYHSFSVIKEIVNNRLCCTIELYNLKTVNKNCSQRWPSTHLTLHSLGIFIFAAIFLIIRCQRFHLFLWQLTFEKDLFIHRLWMWFIHRLWIHSIKSSASSSEILTVVR